jgi:hypothetical protein
MTVGSELQDVQALHARHEAIASLGMGDAVPEDIRIHFETAKNALLYAWFVYRFHMVAEQHVLSTLEFALRERLDSLGLVPQGKSRPKGLSDWMRLAAATGLIDNARFEPGADLARARAEHRNSLELTQRMLDEGLIEIEYDASQIEIRPDDHLDWVAMLAEQLPKLRNIHAHGSRMLYPTVFQTFRIVANLVDQAYAPHLGSQNCSRS